MKHRSVVHTSPSLQSVSRLQHPGISCIFLHLPRTHFFTSHGSVSQFTPRQRSTHWQSRHSAFGFGQSESLLHRPGPKSLNQHVLFSHTSVVQGSLSSHPSLSMQHPATSCRTSHRLSCGLHCSITHGFKLHSVFLQVSINTERNPTNPNTHPITQNKVRTTSTRHR